MEAMIIQRRNFLIGLSATIAAPAIVRVQSIMPIKTIIDVDEWHHIVIPRVGGGLRAFDDGVVDEFRFTKGITRFAGNFIPPNIPYIESTNGEDFTIDWWSVPPTKE
jgi:hypothetical protein